MGSARLRKAIKLSVDKKSGTNKRIRRLLDIAMTIMLPILMAYSLVGEMLHEIIGTLMLVLFVLHHVMNRKWYPALFKGKYDGRRIFHTVCKLQHWREYTTVA